MVFYLGTHELSWLRRTDVPLFVSAVRFRRQRTIPKARGRWALDSGGFSQLQVHGQWTGTDAAYATEVKSWVDQVGSLPDFAAPRDWMCEPHMLVKTNRTIEEHQFFTTLSVINLRAAAPEIPWMPVIQGWKLEDYEAHVEMYREAGIDLTKEPIVGVGSVCRRQGTLEAARIMRRMAGLGIRVHAFGVKVDGLKLFGDCIGSADSMAWSFVARRRNIRMDGCTHKTCANCMKWAMEWHSTRIDHVEMPRQQTMACFW